MVWNYHITVKQADSEFPFKCVCVYVHALLVWLSRNLGNILIFHTVVKGTLCPCGNILKDPTQ